MNQNNELKNARKHQLQSGDNPLWVCHFIQSFKESKTSSLVILPINRSVISLSILILSRKILPTPSSTQATNSLHIVQWLCAYCTYLYVSVFCTVTKHKSYDSLGKVPCWRIARQTRGRRTGDELWSYWIRNVRFLLLRHDSLFSAPWPCNPRSNDATQVLRLSKLEMQRVTHCFIVPLVMPVIERASLISAPECQ